MAVVDHISLEPLSTSGDPDDYRLESRLALLGDPLTDMSVVVEDIAIGEQIALHRHTIDEVLLIHSGRAEVRLGEDARRVAAGAVVFIPRGLAHGTRNIGNEPVRIHAIFPSSVITLEAIGRNPAPGTEDDDPQPPTRSTCARSWPERRTLFGRSRSRD